MPLQSSIVIFNDEFEGYKGTIEVEVVDYGRGNRLKMARKIYGSSKKPQYKSLGTLDKNELIDLIEVLKEANEKM